MEKLHSIKTKQNNKKTLLLKNEHDYGRGSREGLLVVNKEIEQKPSRLGSLKVSPSGWEKGARGQSASSSEEAELLSLVLHFHPDLNPLVSNLTPHRIPFLASPAMPAVKETEPRSRAWVACATRKRRFLLLGWSSRGASWLWGNNRIPSLDACWDPQRDLRACGPQGAGRVEL